MVQKFIYVYIRYKFFRSFLQPCHEMINMPVATSLSSTCVEKQVSIQSAGDIGKELNL